MSESRELGAAVETSIGPHSETPNVRLRNWVKLNAHQHLVALDLLFAAIGASEEPMFMRNIFEEIREAASLLATWRDAGVNTFGLTGIAEVVRSNPDFLELSGARRRTEHSVASSFGPKTGHLYLYKMLSARHSYLHANSPEQQSWSRVLRLWILVQALDRARKSNFNDRLLEEVCDSVRKAAEGSDQEDWPRVTDMLKTNQRDFDQISLHLMFTVSRLVGTATERQLAPKHVKFLNSLLAVGRGRSDPLRDASATTVLGTQWDVSDFVDESEDPTNPELDPDEPSSVPFLAGSDEDEDSVGLPSDPEKSLQTQDARAYQLQLLLGAEARYVVWGWQKLNPFERKELDGLIEATFRTGDSRVQLLAAFVEISLQLGLSLKRALRMPCGNACQATDSWSVVADRKLTV